MGTPDATRNTSNRSTKAWEPRFHQGSTSNMSSKTGKRPFPPDHAGNRSTRAWEPRFYQHPTSIG